MKKISFPRLKIILIIVLTFYTSLISAQNNQKEIYAEGVYFTPSAFFMHKASLAKADLLSGNSKIASIRSWIKSDSLYYHDKDGIKHSLQHDSVWAIYEGDQLYIQRNQLVHKVNTLGMLSLFNESYPVTKTSFSPVATDQTRDVTPKMIDLQSGIIYEYSIDALAEFLKTHDENLFIQFTSIHSKKEKRNQLYRFIEHYNDKYPLP